MNFIDAWIDIIRRTSTVSTYKMAWAKAITHIASEMDFDESEGGDDKVEIPLESIAEKFLGYYWDQDVFFRLLQNSNPRKLAAIVTLVRSMEGRVHSIIGESRPVKFHRASALLKGSDMEFYRKCVEKTAIILKKDVSYRFLSESQFPEYGWIYDYERDGDSMCIRRDHLFELSRNLSLVLDVINLRWVMILEKFNSSPRIARKVKHMDVADADRSSLRKYHELILMENPEMVCFECGNPISPNELAVDHVIPWSYLYSDDIWNLVFIHRSCNSRKSNTVPSQAQIDSLKDRNVRLLNALRESGAGYGSRHVFELEDAIENDLLRKFWVGCVG